MTSRDAVRNSKAQSGALAFLGHPEVSLPKGLENYLELLGRDARPLIGPKIAEHHGRIVKTTLATAFWWNLRASMLCAAALREYR